MFPDTAYFTDPAYTTGDPTADPLDPNGGVYNTISPSDPAYQQMMAGNVPQTGAADFSEFFSPNKPPVTTGGLASNSPAQSNKSGSSLLGWLGLANNVANTVVNPARAGAGTRTGVNQKPTSSLGSFGAVTSTTLIVIVLVFVGVVFMLKRRG